MLCDAIKTHPEVPDLDAMEEAKNDRTEDPLKRQETAQGKQGP